MGFSFDLIALGWLGAAALDDLIEYDRSSCRGLWAYL
jgi:hypothetical protein